MFPAKLSQLLLIGSFAILTPAIGFGQIYEEMGPSTYYAAPVCDPCTSMCDDCHSPSCGTWFDGLELFAGLDGSKQPQDFGVNAHFGGRLHANWGIPVFHDSGIGIQIGTALSQTDHAVAVTNTLEGSSGRTQSFITAGVFQRSCSGWNWGVVYDYLYEDDYDLLSLSQIRGTLSYELNECNEIGFVGMAPLSGADADWGGNAVYLRPLAQGRFFWRHWWQTGAHTTAWMGMADSHGQANVALGDSDETGEVIVFGADFQTPLNDYVALYGEANFVTPADTGTVDAFLGIAFYPGGGAWRWQRRQSTALLPVAGSPSFSTDLRR
ncbi:DUF6666 family protein [Bremerella sp. P1]|uniref:DUF6666 family protein n=1 Tax=Bremerella sp. P1 TaxID=3026424 RepID=UPI002367BA83|nr:DUF6666 family protein [Bremerella sp. P1]WDI43007.1 hypothetical protein PSR63_03485 [Bremerella sp. P1]